MCFAKQIKLKQFTKWINYKLFRLELRLECLKNSDAVWFSKVNFDWIIWKSLKIPSVIENFACWKSRQHQNFLRISTGIPVKNCSSNSKKWRLMTLLLYFVFFKAETIWLSFWRSGATTIQHKYSPTDILFFAKLSTYTTAVNIAIFCCHSLRYL